MVEDFTIVSTFLNKIKILFQPITNAMLNFFYRNYQKVIFSNFDNVMCFVKKLCEA